MNTQQLQIAGVGLRVTKVNGRRYMGFGPIIILLNDTYEGIRTSVCHNPSGLLSCYDQREIV
jgi:hypothetical protein